MNIKLKKSMKPKTKDKAKYNDLRHILRKCMNETKDLEWSRDLQISNCAVWQWEKLNKIFKMLGEFSTKD